MIFLVMDTFQQATVKVVASPCADNKL